MNNKISERYYKPYRIKQARIIRGYSQKELSSKIGVSKQLISKYEIETKNPNPKVMNDLMRELDFPIEFFTLPANESFIDDSAAYFRSLKTTPKKDREAMRSRRELIHLVYRKTKDYINFPENKLPDISHLLKDEFLEFEDIQSISEYVRDKWELGDNPINNVTNVLELNGIVISHMSINEKGIEAFSSWYEGIPYIYIGKEKKSAVRMRFALAHELGHLLMHKSYSQNEIYTRAISDQIEMEANRFAGAFLLPESRFAKQVISSSIDYYLMRKMEWKVSVVAMMYRIEDLKLFSDNQIKYFRSQITRRKMWRNEKYDDVIKYEEPSVLREAIELLVDNDLFDKANYFSFIPINRKDLTEWCFLPNDFFKEIEKRVHLKLVK